MQPKLFKIPSLLFGLCLFFIPFDGGGFFSFGEFSEEAYILFLLFFIMVYGIQKLQQPLYLPKISLEIQLLLGFVGILLLSSIINLPSIVGNQHPIRTGFRKLIGQLAVLFFFFPLVTVFFFDYMKRKLNIANFIRDVFTITLYLVFVVGFFEVLWVVFKIPIGNTMLDFFDQFSLMSISKNTWAQRISSLTKEPPSLGMFLVTVLPWILAFKPKRLRLFTYYLPLLFILFLAFYSGSRSGMFIVALQFFFFFFMEYTIELSVKKITVFFGTGAFILIALPLIYMGVKDIPIVKAKLDSYDFIENYQSNVSNKTRLGTYLASLETVKKHPILGVGYGQGGFYVVEDYPAWAAKNNPEITRYRRGEEFPPMFNIYFRFLTETGVLGLLAFLSFLCLLFLRPFYWWYRGPKNLKRHYLVLTLSIIGVAFTWIQFDTPRVLGFWVFFGFYLYVYDKTLNYAP